MDNQEVLDNLGWLESDLEGILDHVRALIVGLKPPAAKKGKKK